METMLTRSTLSRRPGENCEKGLSTGERQDMSAVDPANYSKQDIGARVLRRRTFWYISLSNATSPGKPNNNKSSIRWRCSAEITVGAHTNEIAKINHEVDNDHQWNHYELILLYKVRFWNNVYQINTSLSEETI